MVGNVPKGKPFFSMLLIWASVVLQAMGALLLACGTIVTGVSLIQKEDGFYWIVVLLGGAVLSANLSMLCLLLGYRKRPCRDLSVNIQLPACVESGFRRSNPVLSATDRLAQSQTASGRFSDFKTGPSTQLKIIR